MVSQPKGDLSYVPRTVWMCGLLTLHSRDVPTSLVVHNLLEHEYTLYINPYPHVQAQVLSCSSHIIIKSISLKSELCVCYRYAMRSYSWWHHVVSTELTLRGMKEKLESCSGTFNKHLTNTQTNTQRAQYPPEIIQVSVPAFIRGAEFQLNLRRLLPAIHPGQRLPHTSSRNTRLQYDLHEVVHFIQLQINTYS